MCTVGLTTNSQDMDSESMKKQEDGGILVSGRMKEWRAWDVTQI